MGLPIKDPKRLAELKHRTRGDLDTLHLAKIPEGFFCLDINRLFQTYDHFLLDGAKFLDSLEWHAILPAAKESLWMQSLKFDTIRSFFMVTAKTRFGRPIRVVLLKGEFIDGLD